MREQIQQWLIECCSLRGLLACGVRYPDQTVFIPLGPARFPKDKLENALRCMADMFQVLKLNQFPNDYVRWIYGNALLYCIRRADGTFLALFTRREPEATDLDGLGKALAEFAALGVQTTV